MTVQEITHCLEANEAMQLQHFVDSVGCVAFALNVR